MFGGFRVLRGSREVHDACAELPDASKGAGVRREVIRPLAPVGTLRGDPDLHRLTAAEGREADTSSCCLSSWIASPCVLLLLAHCGPPDCVLRLALRCASLF